MKFKHHFNSWFIASFATCGTLLLLQLIVIDLSPWNGDYWEHRAVVRELSLKILHPSHPILNVDVPHAFFSPYLVLLGAIVSVTGITVPVLFNIVMLINLLLFFVAVYQLTKLFTDEESNRSKAFLLLLLLILFFWGTEAPLYSSFFHFRSLIVTLVYPSTFSFICAVFAATVTKKLLINSRSPAKEIILGIVLSLLLCIIILTHPLTFVFAACLLLYVYLNTSLQYKFNQQLVLKKTLFLFASVIVSVALAYLWPYFPVFALLNYVESGNKFHADSFELYVDVLWKIFPVLLLPFLVFFNRSILWKKEWPLLFCLAILLLIYAVGFYTKSYGMGRMIAFAVIFCHLLLLKNLLLLKQAKAIWWGILMFLVALPCLFQSKNTFKYLSAKALQRVFDTASFQQTKHRSKAYLLSFLEPVLEKKSPVVLTDLPTGLFIPAMGGKVVAAGSPVYWVSDADKRRQQVNLFFSAETTDKERRNLIITYKPDYLLLTPATTYLLPQLLSFIHPKPIVGSNGINLYQVKFINKPGHVHTR